MGINFSDGNVPNHSTLDFQSLFLLPYQLSTKIITTSFWPLLEPLKLLILMLWPFFQLLKVQSLFREEPGQMVDLELNKPTTNTAV